MPYQFNWTRAELDKRGVGDIGGSFEPYRNLLGTLDRYETFSKRDADAPGLETILNEVIHWANRQLTDYPSEARNTAVAKVRDAARGALLGASVDRAHKQYLAAPSFHAAEVVLLAAHEYLTAFAVAAEGEEHVRRIRKAVLDDKAARKLFLNTGYTTEHNLSAERTYWSKTRGAVPADINCALCTAAAVVTNVTGKLVTTDEVVRKLYPKPELADPAQKALDSSGLDYAQLYQHPESFTRIGRTLQGGGSMADLSKTTTANNRAASGIRAAVVKHFGVSDRGGEPDSMRVEQARKMMLSPKYDGCVFAVLVESAGHWNFARRTETGVVFVDYQSDRDDMQGPQGGANPQMGVKNQDLGDKHDVTFLAFGTG